MNIAKKERIRILFFIGSILLAVASYVGLWRYHAIITETAFSMSANVIKSDISSTEKCERVRDNLVFTRLSEERKQLLFAAILRQDTAVTDIAEKMEYFSYSEKNFRSLIKDIDALRSESISTFQKSKSENAEENAKELIRKLFRGNVHLQTEKGDGSDLIQRYYCSNVCVDALADGSLRYLADIRDACGEDPLLAVLFADEDIKQENYTEINGIIFQTVRGSGVVAELCIYEQTGRVFAAKILFTS